MTDKDRKLIEEWLQPCAVVPIETATVRILLNALRERLAQPEQDAVLAEREACAKFVEDEYVRQFERPWREDLAAAIRARGQK